jgi:hypothetical protein
MLKCSVFCSIKCMMKGACGIDLEQQVKKRLSRSPDELLDSISRKSCRNPIVSLLLTLYRPKIWLLLPRNFSRSTVAGYGAGFDFLQVTKFLVISEPFKPRVVNIGLCTTCFSDNSVFCSQSYAYLFRMILTVNSDYFLKQR